MRPSTARTTQTSPGTSTTWGSCCGSRASWPGRGRPSSGRSGLWKRRLVPIIPTRRLSPAVWNHCRRRSRLATASRWTFVVDEGWLWRAGSLTDEGDGDMDPITGAILTGIAIKAAAGVGDVARRAVVDGYEG